MYAGDNRGSLETSYSVKSREVKSHDGAESSATYTRRSVSIPAVLQPLYSSAWDAGMLGGLRGEQKEVTRKLWWNIHWMHEAKAELPHLHLSINNLPGLLVGVWISNKNALGGYHKPLKVVVIAFLRWVLSVRYWWFLYLHNSMSLKWTPPS